MTYAQFLVIVLTFISWNLQTRIHVHPTSYKCPLIVTALTISRCHHHRHSVSRYPLAFLPRHGCTSEKLQHSHCDCKFELVFADIWTQTAPLWANCRRNSNTSTISLIISSPLLLAIFTMLSRLSSKVLLQPHSHHRLKSLNLLVESQKLLLCQCNFLYACCKNILFFFVALIDLMSTE